MASQIRSADDGTELKVESGRQTYDFILFKAPFCARRHTAKFRVISASGGE